MSQHRAFFVSINLQPGGHRASDPHRLIPVGRCSFTTCSTRSGRSSVGRALSFHVRCRRFDPGRPLHTFQQKHKMGVPLRHRPGVAPRGRPDGMCRCPWRRCSEEAALVAAPCRDARVSGTASLCFDNLSRDGKAWQSTGLISQRPAVRIRLPQPEQAPQGRDPRCETGLKIGRTPELVTGNILCAPTSVHVGR